MSPTAFTTIKSHFFAVRLTDSVPVIKVQTRMPLNTTIIMRANHQFAAILTSPFLKFYVICRSFFIAGLARTRLQFIVSPDRKARNGEAEKTGEPCPHVHNFVHNLCTTWG